MVFWKEDTSLERSHLAFRTRDEISPMACDSAHPRSRNPHGHYEAWLRGCLKCERFGLRLAVRKSFWIGSFSGEECLSVFRDLEGMNIDIDIYIHTYIHTYILTYLHTYILTYIHTYIYIYICIVKKTYIYTYTRTSRLRIVTPPSLCFLHGAAPRTYRHNPTYISTDLPPTHLPTCLYLPTHLPTYPPTYLHSHTNYTQCAKCACLLDGGEGTTKKQRKHRLAPVG